MPARQVKTETVVKAAPMQVWEVITDTATFPRWNPFAREVSGPLEPGGRLTVRIDLDGRTMTFRPTVSLVDPPRELRWEVVMGHPRLFHVERGFQLFAHGTGRTRFVQWERYTGLLGAALFLGGFEAKLYRGYDAMNQALRLRAESSPIPAGDPSG
jgi:hypothetical protein